MNADPNAKAEPKRRQLGTAKGDFVVPEDFDTPLPESVLQEFEGVMVSGGRLV